MTPSRSVRCDHPLDEWCDNCYMAAWDRQLVAMLDRPDPADQWRHDVLAAGQRITDAWSEALPAQIEQLAAAGDVFVERVGRAFGVPPSAALAELSAVVEQLRADGTISPPPCRNGRHAHTVRQNSVCDTPTPPPPLVHRAVGAAAVVAATSVVVTVAGVWAAAEWAAGPGRAHAAAARQRAHAVWCRWLG